MEKFEVAKECILNANKICLVAHTHPDGDAIGSLGAMYHFLKEIGKEAYILITEFPEKYKFLQEEKEFEQNVTINECDLLICLDVSSDDRIDMGENVEVKANKTLVIDHHMNNKVTVDEKIIINVEMQLQNQYNLEPRTTYYMASAYAGQLGEGEPYTNCKRVIVIDILNFNYYI